MRRLIAFGYYGGKYSHLRWLLPLLPEAHHYCEPYGGSAAVLLNREPSPVETYNDVYREVTTFFRMLRDQRDALIEAIGLTPYSREELAVALAGDDVPDLEIARRFFVRARQLRGGLASKGYSSQWANCRGDSVRGMSTAVSRWLGSVEHLPAVAERLLRVQIENDEALKVIGRYDSAGTLFYCDPPYPTQCRTSQRVYAHEMSDVDHRELSAVLHGIQGRAAVSGYRCELMDELYADWPRVDAPAKACPTSKALRRESLWMNYSLAELP